jgi:hypothetical protein
MGWYEEAFRLTVVLVAASTLLVCAGLAGLGASVGLAGALIVLAGALSAFRRLLDGAPTVASHDLKAYGDVLWVGPIVAAVVCLLFLGATGAELQALGGVLGLVGMTNYFLRPAYRAGYAVVRFVARVAG